MTQKVQHEKMTAADSTTARRRAGPSLRTIGVVLTTVLAMAVVIVVTRTDGYPRQTVRVFAGTRWLVDRAEGTVVLADAATGRATVRIETDRAGDTLDSVQGPSGAFLLDSTRSEVLTIDQKAVKLADSRTVPELSDARAWTFGAGDHGAVAVARNDNTALSIPEQGTPTALDLEPAQETRIIALDGGIWTMRRDGIIQRDSLDGPAQFLAGGRLDEVRLGSVGASGVLLDRAERRLAWLSEDKSVDLPLTLDLADAVLQNPGPDAPCAWVGAADQVVCVSPEAVVRTVRLTGFTFDRADQLLITDGVAVVLRSDGDVLVLDLTDGTARRVDGVDWADPTALVPSSDQVAVWIDDPKGATAVAVTAEAGPMVIAKRDAQAVAISADGEPKATTGTSDVTGTELESDGTFTEGASEPPPPDDDNIDDPPVAIDDAASAPEGTTVPVAVTANDYDPDGGPVIVIDAGKPAHGTARILNAGTVVYEPVAGYIGTDTFDYTIVDTSGKSASAAVELRLLDRSAPNQAPQTSSDTAQTTVGRLVDIDVLANDLDPEQQAMTIADLPAVDAERGVVSIIPSSVAGRPMIRFEPDSAFPGGEVSFTYRAVDSEGAQSKDTTVVVTVSGPGNRPPHAYPDSAQVRSGASVQIAVLANDKDPDNDPLAVSEVDYDARLGSVATVRDLLVFTPTSSTRDRVTFTYTVTDPSGESSSAAVLVNVLAPDTENRAPVANPDTATAGDRSVTIEPLLNDEDPDDDPLVVEDARMIGTGGTVARPRADRVVFTPAEGFAGTARIAYSVGDGRGGTASSTISVVVTGKALSVGPTARPDTFLTTVGTKKPLPVLANDYDPNGGGLTVTRTLGCAGCLIQSDGTISFTAPSVAGVYPFTYEVRDSTGQTSSASVRVDVVEPSSERQAPIAGDDTMTVTVGVPMTQNVLSNDADPGGDDTKLRITDVERVDRVVIKPVPGGLEVTVGEAFTRSSFAFRYTITDEEGMQDDAEVTVTVTRTPTSSDPIASTRTRSLDAGSTEVFDLTLALSDPDTDVNQLVIQSVKVSSGDEFGTAVEKRPRSIEVAAKAGVNGTMLIAYEVVDPDGNRSNGQLMVTITVKGNSAPVAADDFFAASAGRPVDLDLLRNDQDPDGDPIRIVVQGPRPTQATIEEIDNGGQARFTPSAEFAGGPIVFTYVAVDPLGKRSQPATVTVEVSQCGDGVPTAPDRKEFTPFETPLALDLLSPTQRTFTVSFSDQRGGTVTAGSTPGSAVFTPTPGKNGGGSFVYTVANSCGLQRSGTVSIDINRAPLITENTFRTNVGAPLDIAVDQFASDEERLTVTTAITSGGAQVDIVEGRTLRFTPPPAAATLGIDVTVTDLGGLSSSGRLTVIVAAPDNQLPIAVADYPTVLPDQSTTLAVLDNDLDPDGPSSALRAILGSTTLTINGASIPLALSPDGRSVVATIGPDVHGTGTFTYPAVDAANGTSAPATVTLTVNRPPESVTLAVTVEAGVQYRGNIYGAGVRADPDGDDIVSLPFYYSDDRVVIDFTPGLIIVIDVPADVPAGVVTGRYRITDTLGGTNVGNVTITVINGAPPPTDPPVETAAPTVAPPADTTPA